MAQSLINVEEAKAKVAEMLAETNDSKPETVSKFVRQPSPTLKGGKATESAVTDTSDAKMESNFKFPTRSAVVEQGAATLEALGKVGSSAVEAAKEVMGTVTKSLEEDPPPVGQNSPQRSVLIDALIKYEKAMAETVMKNSVVSSVVGAVLGVGLAQIVMHVHDFPPTFEPPAVVRKAPATVQHAPAAVSQAQKRIREEVSKHSPAVKHNLEHVFSQAKVAIFDAKAAVEKGLPVPSLPALPVWPAVDMGAREAHGPPEQLHPADPLVDPLVAGEERMQMPTFLDEVPQDLEAPMVTPDEVLFMPKSE